MQEKFNISDGIDGSTLYYDISYYANSDTDSLCDNATINTSSCIDGVCEHELKASSSPCSSSANIEIIVSGTNRLGSGLPSKPMVKGITFPVT